MGVMSSSVHSPRTTMRRACRFPGEEDVRKNIQSPKPCFNIPSLPGIDNCLKGKAKGWLSTLCCWEEVDVNMMMMMNLFYFNMLIIFRKNLFRIEKQEHHVPSDPNKILIYNFQICFVLNKQRIYHSRFS